MQFGLDPDCDSLVVDAFGAAFAEAEAACGVYNEDDWNGKWWKNIQGFPFMCPAKELGIVSHHRCYLLNLFL